MNCFAAFEVGKHKLLCHRPAGHDGKHVAVLIGTATIHWPEEEQPSEAWVNHVRVLEGGVR